MALGAADRIVGRTADDRTPGLRTVPSVGRVLAPDAELVVALRPTHVVVGSGADPGALRGAVESAGGSILSVALERLSDVRGGIVRLGALVGRSAAARHLSDSIDRELARVAHEVRDQPPVPAVWVVWADPPIVAGKGTLPHDLLRASGGVNLFEEAPLPWPRPSAEALVALEPEVVVWPLGPGMPEPSDLPADSPWKRWRSARFVTVDGDLVHEAGARVARAVRVLAAGLHPEALDPVPEPDSPSPAAEGGPQR